MKIINKTLVDRTTVDEQKGIGFQRRVWPSDDERMLEWIDT